MEAEAELKRRILELLEKDVEFRYAVAGLLGFSELLKRLDALQEAQLRTLDEIEKLWAELKALREEQVKLREDQRKLWENAERLWREVRALRESQERLWEEVKALREGQNKLWEEIRALREDQYKLWEEVRALREGQGKLWEEVKALREGQSRLWEEVRALKVGVGRLQVGYKKLEARMRELGRAVGMTLEHYTASFLRVYLREKGYPEEKLSFEVDVRIRVGAEQVEFDVLNEDPLVVGEVTTYIGSVEEAEREVGKLLERVRLAESIFGRKAELAVLAVANVEKGLLAALREVCGKKGVVLLTGREIMA